MKPMFHLTGLLYHIFIYFLKKMEIDNFYNEFDIKYNNRT